MITSLPDHEIQRAEAERKKLEPRSRFQFLWDVFFKTRKFKLTDAEVKELTDIEKALSKWAAAGERVWAHRNNLQDMFDMAVGRYLAEPTEERFIAMLAHTYDTFTATQLARAGEQITGYVNGERARLFAPVVRKHLTRIHDSLCAEYVQQETADRESIKRLSGIASGGESAACIEIRNQTDRIKKLLESGDLSDWRAALGPFLP